jgi:Arc/MetJ-type ribon-helix-helix transcriptional regulator
MHISLTDEIAKKLEARVQASKEFTSVEAYVNYVLGEVIKQTEAAESAPAAADSGTYSKDQEDAVKQRLEDLGYLD